MTLGINDDFFARAEVGQDIPPLEKKAALKELFMTWGRRGGELHPVFGDSHLEAEKQATTQAEAKGMDTLHFTSMLAGTQALEFISQMITNWLPSPKGWLFGGQLKARLIRPISPDELISCRGKIAEKREGKAGKCLVCEVWIENETGERAVSGEATIQF